MQIVRQAIKRQVHELVGHSARAVAQPAERADDGLFGPQSASWRVHRDFTTMMIGGVAALLLQMLHPGALAGVWDHSTFRRDMSGRLRGTAQFISGTTYGSTEQAERLIARVRTIHDRVHGILPDGTPYSANDPVLLTWVHVAEVSSFLRSYMRYRNPLLPPAEQDRYFRETAQIARRLGAADVPTSRAAVDSYLAAMRPALLADARTAEVAAALLRTKVANPAMTPFRAVVMDAAVDLLPPWAARMHGLSVPPARRGLARAGALGAAGVVRWALS
jgi:uncharacterized protein (DUF2236 family)